MARDCTHRAAIRITEPDRRVCDECIQSGDAWVHLRLCTSCGHVGCCDSSKNRHATRHFQETSHPIIRSAEPGESWRWCYIDELLLPDEDPASDEWPELGYADWKETQATLHMFMQIAGKVKLARMPKWNQWWHVPFYVGARGFTTLVIPDGARGFELGFDLLDHQLTLDTSDGARARLPLEGRSVADFYRGFLALLHAERLDTQIWPHPVEVASGIPFPEDEIHRSYDRAAVERFFTVTRRLDAIFKQFRGRFRGKCSPVHFFWGSFDLAVSRFSGRRAPPRPGADGITAEGYDEEVSSLGFWPGSDEIGPIVYSYIVPDPGELAGALVLPEAAYYHPKLKEFVLPYDAIRRATDPEATVLAFAESTYLVEATHAGWDVEDLRYRRAELEQRAGEPAPI